MTTTVAETTKANFAEAAINEKLSDDEKIGFLRLMIRIRQFEQISLVNYKDGKMGAASSLQRIKGDVDFLFNFSRSIIKHYTVRISMIPDRMPFSCNAPCNIRIFLDMMADHEKSCLDIFFFEFIQDFWRPFR